MNPRTPALLATLTVAVILVPASPAWACAQASFSPQSYTVGEGEGSVVVTVVNPGSHDRLRTVRYETVVGTAKSGSDYVAEAGTLSFSPSDTSKTIDVDIVDDAANEPIQRFGVRLRPVDKSCITDLGPDAKITIKDNDPAAAAAPTRGAEPSVPSASASPRELDEPSAPDEAQADPSASPDATPTRSGFETMSPSPTPEQSGGAVAAPVGSDGGGGMPGVTLAAILVGAIFAFVGAVVFVRRRYFASPTPP